MFLLRGNSMSREDGKVSEVDQKALAFPAIHSHALVPRDRLRLKPYSARYISILIISPAGHKYFNFICLVGDGMSWLSAQELANLSVEYIRRWYLGKLYLWGLIFCIP
jgi:hypothetical protein